MSKRPTPPKSTVDWFLVSLISALVAIGVIMIFSTSSVAGYAEFHDSYHYIKRHLFYLITGLVACVIAWRIPYKVYQKWALPGLLVASGLVVLTFVPGIGFKAGGANRWLNLGLLQLQPVEILKFSVAVFLAVSLANKQKVLHRFGEGMLSILLVLAIPIAILLKQPDLGNTILILAVTFTLFFLSRIRLHYMLGMLGVAVLGICASVITHPYQLTRVQTFLDPWADPLGKSYHIIQSFIAVGSGGFWGLGIGQGKLKYFYLPLHYSDFIFSILCEEGGFVLAVAVLGLFTGVLFRGIGIARCAKDLFGFYLSLALTLFLVYQAFFNIGVVIGLIPAKGIPLTFISFGGTSLVVSLFFVGVLLNIARTPK